MSGYVDAHHHVWRLDRGDYGWLRPTPRLAPIYRDFTLGELRPMLAAADIGATVLVQAAPTVAETRYLLDVAGASEGLVRGVVGWVDLAAPDAVATLAELAANPLLKSIRPMLHDLDDPAWILRDSVQPALSALTPLRLRFDALVRPRELKPLLRMLDLHPELAVVIDHCAKPDIAGGGWQPWADDIATIAANTCRELQAFRARDRGGRRLDHRRAATLCGPRAAMLRLRAGAVGQRLAGGDAGRQLRGVGRRNPRLACRTA